jgi:hypothetical protein
MDMNAAGSAFASIAGLCSVLLLSNANAGDRVLAYTDQHVVVSADNVDGIYASPSLSSSAQVAREALFGDQPVVIANVQIAPNDPAFLTTESCGFRSTRRIVVCLNADGALSERDQLDVIAFTQVPSIVDVRAGQVASYIRGVLSQVPGRVDQVQIKSENINTCTASCMRIVVLEN